MTEHIDSILSSQEKETLYSLSSLRKGFFISDVPGGFIAYNFTYKEKTHLSFYAFNTFTADEKDTYLRLVFNGDGIPDLNQITNTVFKEYIPYLDPLFMTEAFKWLQIHFD